MLEGVDIEIGWLALYRAKNFKVITPVTIVCSYAENYWLSHVFIKKINVTIDYEAEALCGCSCRGRVQIRYRWLRRFRGRSKRKVE